MKTIIAFITALVISMVPFYAYAGTKDFVAGTLFYWLFFDKPKDVNEKQLENFSYDENYDYCAIAWENNLTNEEETINFFLDSFKPSNEHQWKALQNGVSGNPIPTEQEIQNGIIEMAIEYNKFCNEPWPELINGVKPQ